MTQIIQRKYLIQLILTAAVTANLGGEYLLLFVLSILITRSHYFTASSSYIIKVLCSTAMLGWGDMSMVKTQFLPSASSVDMDRVSETRKLQYLLI